MRLTVRTPRLYNKLDTDFMVAICLVCILLLIETYTFHPNQGELRQLTVLFPSLFISNPCHLVQIVAYQVEYDIVVVRVCTIALSDLVLCSHGSWLVHVSETTYQGQGLQT